MTPIITLEDVQLWCALAAWCVLMLGLPWALSGPRGDGE
jgi:hypothetical protein